MKELFSRYNIELGSEQEDKLNGYYKLLVDWNSRINLTAITDHHDVVVKHFLDSALIFSFISCSDPCRIHEISDNSDKDSIDQHFSDWIQKDHLKVLDVGSGAGFPGVVLAIFRPDWKITLLEPTLKRADFLKHITSRLSLDNVDVIRGRAEEYGHDPELRSSFDLVVSRAVAELRILLEYCMPFVSPEGYFVSYKGEHNNKELDFCEHALNELSSRIIIDAEYKLEDMDRMIYVFCPYEKISDRYPRRNGIPSKRPL